jgi:hypothetical protein
MISQPEMPLPVPFLCCDPGSFAENTLLVRLPEIARRVVSENSFALETVQRIENLLSEMLEGQLREMRDPGAPDAGLWRGYLQPHLGKPWRELSFLVCENIFYRRVLEACGYFQYSLERGLDPYMRQKSLALETSKPAVRKLARRLETWRADPSPGSLREALESNLWGNRADLSIWPAGAEGTLSNEQLHQAEEYLLVNELGRLSQTMVALQGGKVDFLIDNAGFELVCDLSVADLLLGSGIAREVCFHLKAHPTFVSDALIVDTRQTIAFLLELDDPAARALGTRLIEALQSERLQLREHFFWNSTLPAWEMPTDLRADLSLADLVVSKGDAHFRRLIGDLRWEETIPFGKITSYFPARLAALRVAKSEAMVGMSAGQVADLDTREPGWRTNGRWGMIQFQ